MRASAVVFLLSFSVLAQTPGSQDHYRSFAELAAKNTAGVDYSLEVKDTDSKILVMSFHGGLIEPGTSELGFAISESLFDFYTFKALKKGELHEPSLTSSTLHLTSARYDEPELLKWTAVSDFCLGLHGFGGEEADFCVGGGNAKERKVLVAKLTKAFPDLKSCELCCDPFNGVSLKNPINKCRNQGVQVEMSPKIRKRMLSDKEFLGSVAGEFREYLKAFTP